MKVMNLEERLNNKPPFNPIKLAAIGIGAVVALAWASTTIHAVQPGHVGVISSFGKIQPDAVDPGLHFTAPFPFQSLSQFNVQYQKAEATKATAGTHDLQPVDETLTMNYEFDPVKVPYVRNHFGADKTIEAQFIVPALYEAFKAVTAQYTAEELLTRRSEVSTATVTYLQNKLSKYGVIVSDINIRDFEFSDKRFQDSVNNKVIAEQNRQTVEKNKTTELEAAQKNVEIAKSNAEARITEAKATAEAIKIQAEAIQNQGGHDYVQLKIAEKWDGKSWPTVVSDKPFMLNALTPGAGK